MRRIASNIVSAAAYTPQVQAIDPNDNSGKVEISIVNSAKIEFSASVTTTTNWYGYCYNNAIKRFT